MKNVLNSRDVQLLPALALLSFLAYSYFTRYDPPDNFACSFDPEQAHAQFPAISGEIEKIVISGLVDDPFDSTLFDFDGYAVVSINSETRSVDSRGSIFVNEDEEVVGLLVTIEDNAFSNHGLEIATLDETGKLAYDDATAFAFTENTPRGSYPLAYNCALTLTQETRLPRP